MASERRNTFAFKFMVPKVESLQTLSDKMTSIGKGNFRTNYGLILDLLHVKIDTRALVTLAQFYDPPLRCFTFQDFQLAPTLEEFEKILGCNLKDRAPYLGLGEKPTTEMIAKALHLSVKEVASYLETKGHTEGFSRKVLEAKAQTLLAAKDWKAFNAILALLVYGLVLFPNMEDFIDFPAIGVFLAKNPVPTLLADFYHSLHVRHDRKGGVVSCCAPLVQIWLMSHMPKKGPFVENRTEFKWSDRMAALTEKDISWYSRELDRTEIILSCGEFRNIPLMGTRGCINYNPILALRQLGYPMEDKPDDELLAGFIMKEGVEDLVLLRKIRRAWGQVHRKKAGRKNCLAKPPYTQWVKDRVKMIKLPFAVATPARPLSPEPITTIPIEEAEQLKIRIAELQNKKEELQAKYFQAIGEVNWLKRDLEDKEKSLQGSRKRLRDSEEQREKIGDGLTSADANLIAKNEEIERIMQSNQRLREFNDLATGAQKKWRLKCQDQVQKIQDITREFKERLQAESHRSQKFEGSYLQEKLKCERLQADIRRYEEHVAQQATLHEGQIAQQNDWLREAELSDLVIAELREKLEKAEAVINYYNAPEEVSDFVEYSRDVLNGYKEEIHKTKKRLSA